MAIDPSTVGLTVWPGTPLADGAQIVIRSTMCGCDGSRDPDYGYNAYVGFVGLVSYQFNSSVPMWDYLVADNNKVGDIMTVHVLAQDANEAISILGNQFQKVLLQASNGNYVTVEIGGFYVASADQDQARIFVLPLNQGNRVDLYDAATVYRNRDYLSREFSHGQSPQLTPVHCVKESPLRVLEWDYEHGGSEKFDLFLQTGPAPVRVVHRNVTPIDRG